MSTENQDQEQAQQMRLPRVVVDFKIPLPWLLGGAGVLAWFREHDGARYDWAGVMRFAIPFLPLSVGRWFCSEACAAALGIGQAHKLTPRSLAQMFQP